MSDETKREETQPRSKLPDRPVAWVLLLASGLCLALLAYAMLQENVLSQWRKVQRTYRSLLASSTDAKQQQLARDFRVELRQVDLPHIGTVDRCVSCHLGFDNPAMASAEQPFRTHPGTVLRDHPLSDYGCTICHRGQGAATNFREAKAVDAYWDYPLLPAKLTQSSCGICHGTESALAGEHAPELAHGRRLFVDRGCQGCHKLGGQGGQLGPALDREGMKTSHVLPMTAVVGEHTVANWLGQHFDDPQQIVAGSQMPPPRLTPAENQALTIYMLSLQGRDLPQAYIARDKVAEWNQARNARTTDAARLYEGRCKTCHGDGTYSRWNAFFNRFTPAIRGPGLRAMTDKTWLREAVAKGRPGTIMSGWEKGGGGFDEAQLVAMVDYLAEGDGRPAQSLRPTPPNLSAGHEARGAELFTQLCSACHGLNGSGGIAPTLSNPVFLASTSDDVIATTIINGRADTAMPSFQRLDAAGLSDQEVRDLVKLVRSFAAPPVAQR